MKSNALLAAVTLAASVLAAPKNNLAARALKRELGHNPLPTGPSLESPNVIVGAVDKPGTKFSTNWCGAALEQPPPNATYTAVSATFTVPEPSATKGNKAVHGISAWVGIDGDTYQKTILQTGVDSTIINGKRAYHAWYEWYPDFAHDFNLEVGAGDVIAAQVRALSPSQGVAILENQSNGQSVTKTLNAPSPTATLVGRNAEWILENFELGGKMVGLVDFGEVTFSGAEAEAGDLSYGVSGATIMEIIQDGQVITHVDAVDDSTLVIKYL